MGRLQGAPDRCGWERFVGGMHMEIVQESNEIGK